MFCVNEVSCRKRISLRVRHVEGDVVSKLLNHFTASFFHQSDVGQPAFRLIITLLLKGQIGEWHIQHQIAHGLVLRTPEV